MTSGSERDYSEISPTAHALLRMKAEADLPYAAEAARLLWGEPPRVRRSREEQLRFLLLLTHFEARYRTVDELVRACGARVFLELSSGFGFRGLDLTRTELVRYVDTDLPGVIDSKRAVTETLRAGAAAERWRGTLMLEALDALDAGAFENAAAASGDGPLCLVNEGLLVYLGDEEKRRLCANILRAIRSRGGMWITGDVYVRREVPSVLMADPNAARFHAAHHTEENKFESFEEAEAFFGGCGFAVAQRVIRARAPLRGRELLRRFRAQETLTPAGERGADEPFASLLRDGNHAPARETWCLIPR